MKIRKEHVEYALLFFALVILFWSVLSLLNIDSGVYAGNTQQGSNIGLPDKCKTPSGYTDEEWKTHMGHHPDVYAECLK